ncbi:hypothetical protein WR25_17534 [Diploscapter pachys]|uniref:Uncharacterized protein n=1 Tax=Diploscapter pachys TaxID=2018661 RepID=A0A2A2KD63_9BILA|nr:hypothetical protein WR25_17534 [Diploscapter pachys]
MSEGSVGIVRQHQQHAACMPLVVATELHNQRRMQSATQYLQRATPHCPAVLKRACPPRHHIAHNLGFGWRQKAPGGGYLELQGKGLAKAVGQGLLECRSEQLGQMLLVTCAHISPAADTDNLCSVTEGNPFRHVGARNWRINQCRFHVERFTFCKILHQPLQSGHLHEVRLIRGEFSRFHLEPATLLPPVRAVEVQEHRLLLVERLRQQAPGKRIHGFQPPEYSRHFSLASEVGLIGIAQRHHLGGTGPPQPVRQYLTEKVISRVFELWVQWRLLHEGRSCGWKPSTLKYLPAPLQTESIASVARLDHSAVLPRVAPEPLAKGLVERAGIGKPQTFGDLAHRRFRAHQPGSGELTPHTVLQPLVGLPLFGKTPAQGRSRQAQALRQAIQRRPLRGGLAQQVGANTPCQAGRVAITHQDITRCLSEKALQLLLAAPQR